VQTNDKQTPINYADVSKILIAFIRLILFSYHCISQPSVH